MENQTERILIAAGITGSGKSTLLNVLTFNQAGFGTADSAGSCTHQIQKFTLEDEPTIKETIENINEIKKDTKETKEEKEGKGEEETETKEEEKKQNQRICTTYVDAPGQADPDQKQEEIHHQQMNQLISESALASWMFLISPANGGRISDSDIESYRRIVQCFGATPDSILGVINRIPDFPNAENLTIYKLEVLQELERLQIKAHEWVFVPDFDNFNESSFNNFSYNFNSPSCNESSIRNQLAEAVSHLQAHQHQVLRERETQERLEAERQDLINQQILESTRQAAEIRETERIAGQRAQEAAVQLAAQKAIRVEAERVAQQTILANQQAALAQQVQRQAEENERIRLQQVAEAEAAHHHQLQLNAQAAADAVPIPIRCEQARGNPCCRTKNFTTKQVRDSLQSSKEVPYYNCKNEGNQHHCPRDKRF